MSRHSTEGTQMANRHTHKKWANSPGSWVYRLKQKRENKSKNKQIELN